MWPAKAKDDTELLGLFEESGRNVEKASCLLRDLFAEYPERPEIAGEVLDCEHEGDRITHEILSRLAEHGVCALDPADVHALAGAVDDIVDHAEEAADQLGLYGVEAPMEQAQRMTDVLVDTAGHVAVSLRELRAGEDLAVQLIAIHRLEDEADRIVRAAVASLFAAGIDPMMVIRWKAIYDTLESAVDACETVANVLEGITLKRAANGRY
jgi:predicted phosphate transport protein (TIGR00153 family)